MADQSDIAKALFDALPKADTPEGWREAPIIDAWMLEVSPNEREVAVAGRVSGSAKFPDGDLIRTSALRSAGARRRFVVTQNSVYRLGWPERVSLEPDADHVWPPVLTVAAAPRWSVAVREALAFTGTHTLPVRIVDDILEAIEDGDWSERRAACKAVADELITCGSRRPAVLEAWRVLAANLEASADRQSIAGLVKNGFEEARRGYERDIKVAEASAEHGWRLLASMAGAQVQKLPQEGVPIDDAIAAAHRVGTIVEASGTHHAAQIVPVRLVESADGDPLKKPGVVVLRHIGNVETYWGKEIKRALKPIAGVELPLTPVPDLAGVRSTLGAEFPYAVAQIDTVLSDLVGARHAKFRPTLFAGPPGNGKSRLCRRLGELVGLHVTRNDCASDDDNSFGGTPRRWSSGEPAVPVRAMLSAKRADALILCDELDKTGVNRNHGRMQDVLLSFLENETAARFCDPFVQAEVDCSHLSFFATANEPSVLDAPLRDRLRIVRIPQPTAEDVPALARGIVRDLAKESGMDERWFPPLDGDERDMATQLWRGGSVRRLREIVSRILVKRADMPRH